MLNFRDKKYILEFGDCLDLLQTLPENSIDTCITDPPSGIGFMGKQWDNHSKYMPRTPKATALYTAFSGLLEPWEVGFLCFTVDWASYVLRALKPGATALVWGLPRTVDLTILGLRLAGFEIRDLIAHLYGEGIPKGQNLSKEIDKKLGAKREKNMVPTKPGNQEVKGLYEGGINGMKDISAPVTPEAVAWNGFGTQLKPAREDWVLAMKPKDKTFVNNALVWGVAGLNIDAGRIPTNGEAIPTFVSNKTDRFIDREGVKIHRDGGFTDQGRYPANVVLSHTPACKLLGTREIEGRKINRFTDGAKPFGNGAGHEYESIDTGPETVEVWDCPETCPVRQLDEQAGERPSGEIKEGALQGRGKNGVYGDYEGFAGPGKEANTGGASRFFYVAKPKDAERNLGLSKEEDNAHVTVKPLALMEYFCNLTRPPHGGIVLDPFAGSGTIGMACMTTQRQYIGFENDPVYFELAKKRLQAPLQIQLLPGV